MPTQEKNKSESAFLTNCIKLTIRTKVIEGKKTIGVALGLERLIATAIALVLMTPVSIKQNFAFQNPNKRI